MTEAGMDSFRGLAIMLLTIIAYMLIDSLTKIRLIALILCIISGVITLLTCKKIDRKELNTFRATLMLGALFFITGNIIIHINSEKAYYDSVALYTVTLGFFLSAVGMIIIISSAPLIIYKDVEEHAKRKQAITT